MTDHQFILIVPPTGLLEVIHAEKPIDPEATIHAREKHGHYIRLTAAGVSASWMNSESGTLNPRARTVFSRITKVHLAFTGTVLFEGIDEDRMGEMVGLLSLPRTAGGSNP